MTLNEMVYACRLMGIPAHKGLSREELEQLVSGELDFPSTLFPEEGHRHRMARCIEKSTEVRVNACTGICWLCTEIETVNCATVSSSVYGQALIIKGEEMAFTKKELQEKEKAILRSMALSDLGIPRQETMNASKDELIDKILETQKGKKKEERVEKKEKEDAKPKISNLADIRARTMNKTKAPEPEAAPEAKETVEPAVAPRPQAKTMKQATGALEGLKDAFANFMAEFQPSGGGADISELQLDIEKKMAKLSKALKGVTKDLNGMDDTLNNVTIKVDKMEEFLCLAFSGDKENPFSDIDALLKADFS